ncbi:MAG TPA: FkbM family methyltransferase [Gaiellaceae bacterium]|nr:FkbM family methyltransferase [Gaiellaceae bacterium]
MAVARRLLAPSSAREAAELLAALVSSLPADTVGELMERLPPSRMLDYEPHPIRLVVSSSAIALRLASVEKEPFTVEWIEQSVKPGDVFYDIGANVGAYSMIAAKASDNRARVFAFEPSPASFLDLSRNIVLNGCRASVIALPVALWSRYELLALSPGRTVAGSPSRPDIPGAAEHRLTNQIEEATPIIGVPLDDLVERLALPVPNHAKIDTDGYELDVLRGAASTLARPEWQSIIIELDRDETARNAHIRALLADAGFGAGRAHPRRSSPAFPRPERRPDVYWTFTRAKRRPRVRAAAAPSRPPATAVATVRRRTVAATLTVVSLLFLLLVLLPEELGDRPYDVFGLRF